MFESILEKILINNFGNYITGLDRSNLHLGVWSGNIIIENVNIKQEVLDMFEFPIKMIFNSIGKLQLIIPWSKLSTNPVEINLESVFIVVEPKNKEDWIVMTNYSVVQRKLDILLTYSKQNLEKFMKKQLKKSVGAGNTGKKDEGFIDKMTMKIVDNIQIKVKDIHIRFEDSSSPNDCYSFGITLDEIIVVTTDENWKKMFLDRTEEKNKGKPINKLLLLKHFGIYWNSKEDFFFSSQKDKNVAIKNLQEMIIKEDKILNEKFNYMEYIINISAEVRLIQNSKDLIMIPEFQLFVNLNSININLKNAQLQQIIKLIDKYIAYNERVMIHRFFIYF